MSSAYSSLYARPEQPVVRTPRRRPTPFPRLVRNLATWLAAVSVSEIAIVVSGSRDSAGRRGLGFDRRRRARTMLLLVIGGRRLDRVLGENRAVNLHRRKCELRRYVRVLDRQRLIERLTLDPLGHQRRRCDRRATAVGLALRVFYCA